MQFSCRELRDMRRTVAATFDKTAEILQDNGGSNGRVGKAPPNWVVVSTTTASVLPAVSPGDSVEGARLVDDERRRIRFPYGTAISSINRVRIGSLTYAVLAVLDDQSFPVSIDCDCRRLA